MPGHGRPAFVIDAAVAHHFEVLRLVPLFGFAIVERVCHRDAFDWLLHDTVYERGFR